MRARTKWVIVGALSLIGMVLSLALAQPRQPSYQGRKLDAWLADLANPNYETQRLAQAAIREMGPAAVPFLTNSLAQRNAVSIRVNRKNILPRRFVNWTRRLVKWQSPMMESRNAALALQTLGPSATNAIPELIAALSDPSISIASAAVTALGAIGTNAVPAVGERLRLANAGEMPWVLNAVAALGTNAAPLAPRVVELLASTNTAFAGQAVLALIRIGGAATLPLRNLLQGTNAQVQSRALTVLGQYGPVALSASNELVALTRSADSNVRYQARVVLGSALPPRDFGVPIWLEGLRDPDVRSVEASLRFLTVYPTNVRQFNREIAALAFHPTNSIRQIASNALTVFRAWPKQ